MNVCMIYRTYTPNEITLIPVIFFPSAISQPHIYNYILAPISPVVSLIPKSSVAKGSAERTLRHKTFVGFSCENLLF